MVNNSSATGAKAYEEFWSKLAPAYPVSRGSMRVPIVTELQSLPDVVVPELWKELASVLE